jgi:hypothetical protein
MATTLISVSSPLVGPDVGEKVTGALVGPSVGPDVGDLVIGALVGPLVGPDVAERVTGAPAASCLLQVCRTAKEALSATMHDSLE